MYPPPQPRSATTCSFLFVFPLFRMILSTAYATSTLVIDFVKLKPWSRSLVRRCSGTGPYLQVCLHWNTTGKHSIPRIRSPITRYFPHEAQKMSYQDLAHCASL